MSSSSPDTLDIIISSSGDFQETPPALATTGATETPSTELTGMTTDTSCPARSQPTIRMAVATVSNPDEWASVECNLTDIASRLQGAEEQREYDRSEELVGPSNPPAHLMWFHNKLERERQELLNRDGGSPDFELVRHWYNLTAERDHLFRVAYCQNTREELLQELLALEKRCGRLLKVATCPAPVVTHFRKYLRKIMDIIPLVNNHLEKYSHPADYAEYRSASQQISTGSTPEIESAPLTGDLASEPGIYAPVEDLHQIEMENLLETSHSTYLPSYYSRSYNRTYNGLRYESWYVPSSCGSAPAHVRVPRNDDANSAESAGIQSKVPERERPATAGFDSVAVDLPSDGAKINLYDNDNAEIKPDSNTPSMSNSGLGNFRAKAGTTDGNNAAFANVRASANMPSRADETADTSSCSVVTADTLCDDNARTNIPGNESANVEMPNNEGLRDVSNSARVGTLATDLSSNDSARNDERSGVSANMISSSRADDCTSSPIGETRRLESEEFFSPITEGTSTDSLVSEHVNTIPVEGESASSRLSSDMIFRFSD